jgi:ribonuclease Z
VVLGTASQVPTRHRNHNGYLLRWDVDGFLFDPGEGTQRQLTHAGVSATSITVICITHLHGDHCLGLPGILQRLSLDRIERPIHLCYPASGQVFIDRLRHASIFDDHLDVRCLPVHEDGPILAGDGWTLSAHRLDHRVDSIGYQVREADRRHMLPDRLAAAGITGPAIGRLQREGRLVTPEGTVTVEHVSRWRAGQRFGFVMDTRRCEGADLLAERADLLVCEATFVERDAALADAYGHLTAAQAATMASGAQARRLVLTHFSQRYPDAAEHLAEARALFGDVVAAEDLMRVAVPPRTFADAG